MAAYDRSSAVGPRLLLALLFVLALACTPQSPPPDPPASCEAGFRASELERFAAGEVALFLDDDGGLDEASRVESEALQRDLERYLGALWGEAPRIVSGAPDESARASLWISTSEAALARAGDVPTDGYVVRRLDEDGRTTVVVAARDRRNLAHGAYALLEELGARFFHPREELLPSLGAPHLPRGLALEREPAFYERGIHLHLLHPIEYLPALLEPSADNLEDAKRFIDWLVKTGQNHLQFSLLLTPTLEELRPHLSAVLDYAHARGVTVGVQIMLWEGSSLQNGYTLIRDDAEGLDVLEARLEDVLALPFDGIELGLGEFFAGDPVAVVAWLDHATQYLATAHPEVQLSIINHVGNYPELWVEHEGEEIFYYHLPGRADPRLANTVHTVFFFDLYRSFGGYGHDDFALQREFLLAELPERTVRYMPESAYWVSADIDVPAFLPEFIRARWIDVKGIHEDTARLGLPPLSGHVLYSSGHEWGYWLTDYLTARMLWEPGAPLEEQLARFSGVFGACAGDVDDGLRRFLDLETRVLFEQRLIPYVSADDLHDDLGAAAGYVTIPARVPFEALLAMSDDERAAFDDEVVRALDQAAQEAGDIEASIEAACGRADDALAPWCDELRDGVAIVKLRMEHSARLYTAVLEAVARKGDPDATLASARALTDEAAQVIARREAGYRFDVEVLTGAYDNPTRYPFGYLRQAHTQCLWHRQEAQVAHLLENGEAASPFALPTCQD